MAKKARASQLSLSHSPESTQTPPKMVLRVRPTEATKRVGSQEETRMRSTKKSKPNQKKKQIKNSDAKMPKKPPTAFFYFLEDFKVMFKEQNPDIKSMRDIGKACGEKWKTMTYEEKVHYYDIAAEKRVEFDTAMADYKERKESGEQEETDGDSEFDQ